MYFENRKGTHNKFYKIAMRKLLDIQTDQRIYVVETWRGKVGTNGVKMSWDFGSEEEAQRKVEELKAQRLQHDYTKREVPSLEQLNLL